MTTRTATRENATTSIRPLALPEPHVELDYFHLFWIYFLVSVVGLFIETLVSFPIDGVWKDRAGLMWGPFSPIYGLGAVLVTVLLDGVRRAPIPVLFVCAAIVGGFFEWCAGTLWERAFGFVAWSYANQPFNIDGHTCLGISLVWGLAGVIWMRVFLPTVIDLVELIPHKLRKTITSVFSIFMALDIATTIIGFSCWLDRNLGKPIDTPVEQYFAQQYPDEFMEDRFETISMFPELANRASE